MATTARATPPTNLDVWLMGQKVREAGAVGDEAVATAVLVELRARPGAAAQYVRCNPATTDPMAVDEEVRRTRAGAGRAKKEKPRAPRKSARSHHVELV